ncbi:MAG: hypothetical protein KJ906_01905 [Nanoarchaeota archaeon]|nr:hypothetical protein [Nanoarchaeota archaeon]
MIYPDKINEVCNQDLLNYIQNIKKYSGRPHDERITRGFSRGGCEFSRMRYIFNDLPNGAEPNELGICNDCKFITKEQLKDDLNEVRDWMKESVNEGYVNIEGIPYTSCDYWLEWWYMRDGQSIVPLKNAIDYPYNFNIKFNGSIQKKNILELRLDIGIDFILSDDTFSSSIQFQSKKPGEVDIKLYNIAQYPEVTIFSELFDSGSTKINQIMSNDKIMKDMTQRLDKRIEKKNDQFETIMRNNEWISNSVINGFYNLAKCDRL